MKRAERLEDYIVQSGLKRGYIAEQVGLSRQGLRNRLRAPETFRASQVGILCELLGIEMSERESIFFAPDGA